MKHDRIAVIGFTVVNIILIAACGIFFFRADRVKPEFKFQLNEITYSENMDPAGLMDGITAEDNRDGNVTDRIVIEKMVEGRKDSSVVVFYAVSDKAGNVAKISRVFPARFVLQEDVAAGTGQPKTGNTVAEEAEALAENNQPDASEEKRNAEEKTAGEEERNAARETDAKEADSKETDSAKKIEADSKETDSTKEKESQDGADKNKADNEKPEITETADEADHQEKKEADRDATVKNEDAAAENADTKTGGDKGTKPVIALKNAEVNTSAGNPPAWVEVIGSLKDDRDSYETLFYNLSVSKYDVNSAGTYKVALTTKDSDGNVSDPVTVTIHVK